MASGRRSKTPAAEIRSLLAARPCGSAPPASAGRACETGSRHAMRLRAGRASDASRNRYLTRHAAHAHGIEEVHELLAWRQTQIRELRRDRGLAGVGRDDDEVEAAGGERRR